ncbi:Uridine phosphorylase [Monocercomonoides exilis]|uniref:Uridine phosphorylase n=1 Tax=Monocercomonoides exilis TaxID=2049356 RepID=UPI0035596D9E|nr:Uridine phosphorylase [Monocercomonoides exilis]|eukprot:MONOS_9537.1-p1 / transcript=MONOS_9537.1 / gene=MONOS_9537 / organism=Monocercomonoides_exilis_PA203 / gene_product=Uridine phosphorylase [EC:2.4.2.3] / transcript_product=Uridine phosphorylase [EC:2.4.2.3] / location=Mono_scaffold00397:52203-53171(+) / protein_length=301 / sequence_SO=supercontig / SO=protein_coding / is_pseudo=false
MSTKPTFTDADFPLDGEGRTYHIGIKRGEVANRVLTCGDVQRVRVLEKFLDKKLCEVCSERGFLTVTGLIDGVPVTLLASLMGYPNMDFAVRETLAMVDGTMVCVRFGTCGTPSTECNIGDLALATECRGIYRNPDAFRKRPEGAPEPTTEERYHITLPVPADPALFNHMKEVLLKQFPDHLKVGCNFSGCTFYASQGRPGVHFEDHNEDLLDRIAAMPSATAIEMETFHLFDLADLSKGRLKAAGSALIIAKRATKDFVTPEKKAKLVDEYGKAILHALATFPIPEDQLMKDPACVWLK